MNKTDAKIVTGGTLYEAWRNLNDQVLLEWPDEAFLLAGRELPKGREFSYMTYNCQLTTEGGFGLDPEVTKPFLDPERRIKLLRSRYIDPPLWQEGIDRLELKRRNLGGPMSYVFPFHRPATSAPTGGGCLISVVLSWYDKKWRIHVMSRASEITIRLLGDMYFVKRMVDEIIEEVPIRNWPGTDNVPIDWTLLLCSQMKHVMPFYLLITKGEQWVKKAVTGKAPLLLGEPPNLRVQGMIDYFWELTLHPEVITWAQRRRWSEKFLEYAQKDWAKLERKYGPVK